MTQLSSETPLTENDISNYDMAIPKLFPDARKLVKRIFGEDIQLISREGDGMLSGERDDSSLLEKFFAHALDQGLRKKAKFSGEQDLDPVAMLNRSSFLYELRKRAEFTKADTEGLDIQY